MKLVVLVSQMETEPQLETLRKFDDAIGNPPSGAAQLAQNVWLVDTDLAFQFLVKFLRTAFESKVVFEAFDSVPDGPRASMQITQDAVDALKRAGSTRPR
jgi:hypothetical protein